MMKKKCFSALLVSALAGLGVNQLVCYIASAALRLGYYAACPASLPEQVGGEMNAVLLQMAVFALAGALAGLGLCLVRRKRG